MSSGVEATRDVLIVGSGAAGGAAAVHLAAAGHSVTLLERGDGTTVKPCGGGMAASVQQWFPFSLNPAVEQVIQRVDFSWCLQDPVVAELPGDAPFWIVRRERLDQLLAEQAIQRGAVRHTGVEVTHVERLGDNWTVTAHDGRQWQARSLVIADGSG